MLRNRRLLFVVFVLFGISVANARPTVAIPDGILVTKFCPTEVPATISRNTENIISPINNKLADLGKEFLQPPANSTGLGSYQDNLIKPLPPVPTALLMALTGFLCVSLVRDRRIWLAPLAGILWASQSGIQALPQLAAYLNPTKYVKPKSFVESIGLHQSENSRRLRSDIEGTQYIGLLHHLAGIPHVKSSGYPTYHISQLAAILEYYSLNSLLNFFLSRAKQSTYFTPAFIFENIARGPPTGQICTFF